VGTTTTDRALNVNTSDDTPTAELISKEFAAARRATIDPDHATPCPTDGARYHADPDSIPQAPPSAPPRVRAVALAAAASLISIRGRQEPSVPFFVPLLLLAYG
jgi:hypothetical protein